MHSPLAIHVFGLVRIKICVKVQLEFRCSYLQGCVHPSLTYLLANLNAATFFLGKNPRLFPTQSATSDILLNLVHLPELPIGFTCTSLFSICSNTTPKHWQHSTKYNEHLMPCLLHSDNAQDLHVHYRSLLLHGIYVKEMHLNKHDYNKTVDNNSGWCLSWGSSRIMSHRLCSDI